jgi:hypothetical protein
VCGLTGFAGFWRRRLGFRFHVGTFTFCSFSHRSSSCQVL